MTPQQFAEAVRKKFESGFAARYGKRIVEDDLFGTALDLSLDPDPQTAFHAAYALEYAFFAAPERFEPFHARFVDCFLVVSHPGVHRHYSKIMSNLLQTGSVILSDGQRQLVAERTFDRLIDPKTRVAVKVWSMEILDSLSAALPWVDEQLEETVRFLMRDGSPGLCNRGAKICRRIRQRKASLPSAGR